MTSIMQHLEQRREGYVAEAARLTIEAQWHTTEAARIDQAMKDVNSVTRSFPGLSDSTVNELMASKCRELGIEDIPLSAPQQAPRKRRRKYKWQGVTFRVKILGVWQELGDFDISRKFSVDPSACQSGVRAFKDDTTPQIELVQRWIDIQSGSSMVQSSAEQPSTMLQ